MKKVFIVVCACLLAACHNQQEDVSISSEEFIDKQPIEGIALEDWEFGAYNEVSYYSFDYDSTIEEFIYFPHDTVIQMVLPYYAEPHNLNLMHRTIDDIILEKGWKYPLEHWHDFEEELQDKLGDMKCQLGEIEIAID